VNLRCILPAVLWQEAKAIAQTWADENLAEDLRGRQLTVPDFPDDATCRFFFPERSLKSHKLYNTALGKIARKRGAKIAHEMVSTTAYDLIVKMGIKDTPAARLDYIKKLYAIALISG